MLTENIHTWEDVKSEFCTVQSKGDFWVFAAPVEGVVVDGMPIAGLLKVVDAQQYADVAILPIFNGQGASYVVDENGVILLRPSDSQANKSFESHNIVQILEKEHVDQAVVDTLRSSLKNCTEAQFLMSFQGDTWLLQSFPDGEGRNIVMAIPVSRTAQKTFEGMQSVIGLVAVIVLIVAMLSISWMYYFVSRNQKVKIESARVNLKSDFLTKMSHDIRTPLNAIMGSNELALRSIDDSKTLKKHLETSEEIRGVPALHHQRHAGSEPHRKRKDGHGEPPFALPIFWIPSSFCKAVLPRRRAWCSRSLRAILFTSASSATTPESSNVWSTWFRTR